MFAFTDLRDLLAQYLSDEQVEKISKAYCIANKAHEGQKRYTGEAYITHPIEVARILAGLRMDAECISAAILHDVIEDTNVDKAELAEKFGEKVAELVDGVSKLTQIKFQTRELQQAENFRKMMMAMSEDIRVIMIKLADRLHNMRTLGAVPNEKKRRIALETLEIYAPIARRLGINNMRVEFEDLGFAALYPIRYRVLKESVRRARGNRHALIHKIEKQLKEQLVAAGLGDCKVWGREKHLYSLYKKMQTKRLSLSEVMDVYAFRVIVPKLDDCYLALGVVHRLYRPIAQRFKDYIAVPKPNGYQSLHTILIGPHGAPLEAQIRTVEMDQVAEHGIAAHWLYKTGEKVNALNKQVLTNQWLGGLMDIQKNTTGNPLEFIENVKMDLYSGEVFVFTPKGSIFSLPQGATAVDFAYLVHTDVGNTCVACKINRRLAPLSTRLISGQTIEVINAEGASPNPAWLSFVVTGKAKSNIRHWLKSQQKNESQNLGRRLINALLADASTTLEDYDTSALNEILQKLECTSLDLLLEDVGLGKRMAALVTQVFLTSDADTAINRYSAEPLIIHGTEGLVVTYANCCYPIPGDYIIGHLKSGQGIIIHSENCSKVQKAKSSADQSINVQWEDELQGEFQVPIIVDVINARGVLAEMANAISDSSANIMNVDVDHSDARLNTVCFVISIRDRQHLTRVMRRLRAVGEVTSIRRGP